MTDATSAAVPLIALENVSKTFAGNKQVLKSIHLNVAKGESLVVIGGSGTGKSVLLKCILGLLQPDAGSSIRIDGEETVGLGGRKRDRLMQTFGMLFQGGALFDSLPVWENVSFALLQKGMSRSEARDVAVAKLASVGLSSDVAKLSPAELSGGMQKRVALARAIAGNPAILFFDEPTTGLDPIMADVINELIVKCTRELGSTAITITHDMASARKVGTRIAMLYKGEILWDGPAKKVDESGNPYVEQFIHGRSEGPISVEVR